MCAIKGTHTLTHSAIERNIIDESSFICIIMSLNIRAVRLMSPDIFTTCFVTHACGVLYKHSV